MGGALPSPARLTFAAVIATAVLGQIGLILASFLLPLAMQQTGAGDRLASQILAGEFVGYLVVAVTASSLRRFAAAPVALIACLAYATGSFAAAATTAPLGFFLARLVCGMAGGAVMVSSNRLIASHAAYARLSAASIIGIVVFAVGALVVVPAILQAWGSAATYATLGALALLVAALTPWLQPGRRVARVGPMRFGGAAWALLAAFFLSRLSDAALWPYTERFGERVGFDTATIGLILSGATLVGLMAPFIALRATRHRHIAALFGGALLAKAAAPLLMAAMATPVPFVLAQIIGTFSLVMVGQLFLTRFSSIDAAGRLGGFSGTAGLGADATGLLIAGQTFALWGYAGVAAVSATIGIAAAALCLGALHHAAGSGGPPSCASSAATSL